MSPPSGAPRAYFAAALPAPSAGAVAREPGTTLDGLRAHVAEPGCLCRLHRLLRVPGVDPLGQPVDRGRREAQRLAHLADRHPRPEGNDVGDYPGPLVAVAVVD